ncbi:MULTISPECIES: hypothetical protein [unclassified Nostoc]|uniref:hypothetical protein n=1 Tax=unclassified Nostoc TaxID=2593658 RepID=UPI0025AA498A|nr:MULTISPECIES: hypothetical protein [unclassified Nostoc]MDM9582234.1 hypothetical protein [Nostoc sp. GT001]MDZ7944976.1 hypothetical protein [Nostoc sp. EfeVER01]MDZ7992625.1 hypothetical protein [Nostoc sp. EspVER01]
MNIRRVLAVVAIPFLIGTFGFVAPHQANAANPPHRNAEISQQPNKPEISEKKPQIRHSKPRPHEKKRTPQRPQAHNQEAVPNRVERNNR